MAAVVSNIRFQYDEREDRVRLVCEGQGVPVRHLVFTRRLTIRLVRGLATLLERHGRPSWADRGAAAGTNPLVHEHLAAISRPQLRPPAPAESESPAVNPSDPTTVAVNLQKPPDMLVSHVDVQIGDERFGLTFFAREAKLLRLKPTREELHRLLGGMLSLSGRARWSIPVDDTWLREVEVLRWSSSSQGQALH